ncbi:osmoprotectant transport system permease protein [Pedobacter sp. CG_S7]|uniref:ABC transporter permease/substrate-binding protein n=1 Tax=Pedobacter sp. CG_S7 TaxID=3143930 RepID=UPI0033980F54
MEEAQTFWQFIAMNSDKLLSQTGAHVALTLISLLLSILIAVPLGILIARKPVIAGSVLGFTGILQTIPSIALLGILIPFLGIGYKPAILALFLYALLPILRNTYTGITGVDPVVKDAAKGMGMTDLQILFKVELPLAFPILMAGIRTATVINVGVATLAAYIAAGGLGEFIFGGIALNNSNMILAGAIPAALLAILLDFLLALVQKLKLKKLKLAYLFLPFLLILSSSFYLLPTQIGGRMLAGFSPEFMGRSDGYIGLKSVYGLAIETVVISDAMKYKAAYEKKLDVIDGYSTDGRLKAFKLVPLIDDKHIFPPYYAAPIVRQATLNKYPELEGILNQLAGLINDQTMTALNYRVDKLKESPEQVAIDFLKEKNLYKPDRQGRKGVIRVGSKIFGEQYILAQLYKLLIQGNSDLSVATKTGLGGTKICFDALNNNQIDLYPEYTGTGFLVILKPDLHTVKTLSRSPDAVYQYIYREFKKQYQLKWLKPIGFNNSYALMMRSEQAQSLHIKSISDLTHYINQQ